MSAGWKEPCWNVLAEPGGFGTCVLTLYFPCITYGINVSKLSDAEAVRCHGKFGPACCLYCLAACMGCVCLVHMPARKHIRAKYGIEEPKSAFLQDLLMTCCCSCCALIQEYNQSGSDEGIFLDLNTAMNGALVEEAGKEAKDVVTELAVEGDESAKKELLTDGADAAEQGTQDGKKDEKCCVDEGPGAAGGGGEGKNGARAVANKAENAKTTDQAS